MYSFTKHNSKVLNGLDKMGYRVVSCSNLITGYAKFDTRDMVWTLHKARDEWEASSKWDQKLLKMIYCCFCYTYLDFVEDINVFLVWKDYLMFIHANSILSQFKSNNLSLYHFQPFKKVSYHQDVIYKAV